MKYEDKKQARISKYQNRAQKATEASESSSKTAHEIISHIPMGQPILVGHHSEARHRRDLKRFENNMRKSINLQEKAEYYKQKAKSAEINTSISSDDENALTKLKAKLENTIETKNKLKKLPHEPYQLTNLGQQIRQIKKRIEVLEKVSDMKEIDEQINGIRLVVDKELNRVQLFFNDIPATETRTKLKGMGFKWSHTNGCWQRMISQYAIQLARSIAQETI